MRKVLLTAVSMLAIAAHDAHAQSNIMMIIDASGSMKEKVDGRARMDVAKEVVAKTLSDLPVDTNLGLLVYGHRRAKDCTDLELVAPIGSEDAKTLAGKIEKLTAKGETPIAEALQQAAKSFKAFKGQQNQIILVTDGLEECKGDPCAAAQALKDTGLDVAVNIVGFTLGDDKAKQLQCVTDLTGGKYYSAANAQGLTTALQAVQQQVQETVVVQEATKPSFDGNLLNLKNGGYLIYAPSAVWDVLNGESTQFDGATYSGEAVWGFKDGKAATFDQIEVLVPTVNQYNLKTFEVQAGDDINGPFTSLGEFTVQNTKMQPEGWQGFKFPETKAHFVKVILKDHHGGGYVKGNLLRLKGTLDEASQPIVMPKLSDATDILDPKNGGHLEMAPNDAWKGLNTDHKNFKGPTYAGEGVWSFKGGKAATFSQMEVLVPNTYKYHLKSFEVLAGDDLSGPFTSLGEFDVKNYYFKPTDGWQTFALPETTAHYLKVVLKADQGGGYIIGNALRVRGSVKEDSAAIEKPKLSSYTTHVLAEKNGAVLVASPNEKWKELSRNPDQFQGPTYKGEGVWKFKGDQPATFDQIDVRVNGAYKYNLKRFEVLAGDEATGPFQSLGEFTVQNVKVLPDGWQHFKLPETTAKFVKVVFIDDQGGGYIIGNPIRLMGKQ